MMILPERYNVSTLLDANIAAGRSDKVAIYFGDERITYADLMARVCRMGGALRELGVRREERVLLVLGDTPAFPVAFFGAIRIGAVPVPVNPLYKADDYRHFVEDSDARVVIVDPDYLDKVAATLATLPEPVTVISTGEAAASALRLSDLLADQPGQLTPANTHRDDMAFWLYSSGSTGKPKGVVHLHHDIPYTCETYARHVLRIAEDDIVFSRVFFHAYGLGNAISFPIWAGASAVYFGERPSPRAILATVERFRPTLFFSVPTLYNAILNDPACADVDLSSLRLCVSAAEPLPPVIWKRWHATYGLTILDGIGSTEMLHIFCSNTPDAARLGSSGRPVPGYELRLVDEHGGPAPAGETGDLHVRGESAAVGYWRQHTKTKQTMRGDWVVTGDRYRQDAEGFFWYEGRSDDMIKVNGEWVSPIDIENALIEHAAVSEVAVVGVPIDGIMRIRAVIVLMPGQAASPELTHELQEWCKARLQRYQYPHQIDVATELPKTLSGKVQRYLLRAAGQ